MINQTLNILLLADGPSIHTVRIAQYFIEKGYRVDLITFRKCKDSIFSNVFHINVGDIKEHGNNFQYIFGLPKIYRVVKSKKYDLVFAIYLTSYGLIATMFFKDFFLYVFGTDVKVTARKNLFYFLLTKFVLSRTRHIFSVAEHVTQVITQKFKISKNKITTLEYGIDLSKYNSRIPFNKRSNDIITNRAFIKNSNYPFIIEILREIKKLYPALKAIIFGHGPLKEEIERIIEKYQLHENIRLLGIQNEQNVIDLLNDSKIYLSLPTSDGASLSVMEALACGNYPIVSDIEANHEWVIENENGSFIPLYDVNKAVASILKVLSDKYPNNFYATSKKIMHKKGDYYKNMNIIESIMLEKKSKY